MKLDEIRKIIFPHSSEDLGIIVTELYKRLPKEDKENHQIESLIRNPTDFKHSKKEKIQEALPDIESLKAEVEWFLEDVREGNYFKPNRFIHKNHRGKWRTLVKGYYRQLLILGEDSNASPIAAHLLEKLFDVLCEGSHHYLFRTAHTFSAIRVSREEFFDKMLEIKFMALEPNKFIVEAIHFLAKHWVTDKFYCESLVKVFIKHLKTPDMREFAAAYCEVRVKNKDLNISDSLPTYARTDVKRIWIVIQDFLAHLHIQCCAALYEIERGIEFFKRFAEESWDKEMQLWRLLKVLEELSQKELWTREYENAVKAGVNPRDGLTDEYRKVMAGAI